MRFVSDFKDIIIDSYDRKIDRCILYKNVEKQWMYRG